MRKLSLAIAILVLVGASAGGYLYLRGERSPSTNYATAFSQVELDQVDLTPENCAQNVCATNIGVSVPFKANPGTSPVGYYPDLIMIFNPSGSPHTIKSITAFEVTGDMSDVEEIAVYYFASVAQFNTEGAPSGSPPGFCVITSVLGCGVFSGRETVAPLGGEYIEVIAYAKPGAQQGSVGFSLSVEWT